MQQVWLSVSEASRVLDMPARTVRHRCVSGAFSAKRFAGNGGDQYRVDLASLPAQAQARYWLGQVKRQSLADRRAFLEQLNLGEQLEREVAHAAGIKRRPEAIEPLPITPDEWRVLRERFERLPAALKEEARRRERALQALHEYIDGGRPRMASFGAVAEEFDEHPNTIRRWLKLVRNQVQADWYLLLAPAYACEGAPKAECPAPAWSYILEQWLVQSKPALTAVYRRATKEAAWRGWGELPSLKTIARRIESEVPRATVVLRREGEKALEKLYPAAERDFSTLAGHEMWESDGRRCDVFVRFPDGEVRRPILMVWREVHSRYVLGWAAGKTENTPLVRSSMRDAMLRSRSLPREFLMDNGRAYASKEITGGQPNRYRFKVNADDVLGVTTLLGIKPAWAMPGHGQSKPVESFWRTIAETDKRAEFAGAYCGNRPDAKPEEFADFKPSKAIPLQDYLAAVSEDIEAFLDRAHRGDGMDGRSPREVYDELMGSAVVRTPTAEQIRLCLEAAENKTLDAHDRSVTVLGNRYWSEELSELKKRGPYTVRYNADDASEPVAIYDGDRFICEARLVQRTGFRDQEAAKAHIRARNAFKKAARVQAKSLAQQADAANWDLPKSPTPVAPQAGVPHAANAKLAELVRPTRPRKPRTVEAEPNVNRELEEFKAKLVDVIHGDRQAKDEELWGRRAAGAK